MLQNLQIVASVPHAKREATLLRTPRKTAVRHRGSWAGKTAKQVFVAYWKHSLEDFWEVGVVEVQDLGLAAGLAAALFAC